MKSNAPAAPDRNAPAAPERNAPAAPGGITLSPGDEAELYVVLKPREQILVPLLAQLLRGIEKSLYARLTVEEMEGLRTRCEEALARERALQPSRQPPQQPPRDR